MVRARLFRSRCSASRGRSAAGSARAPASRCRNTSRTRVRGRPSRRQRARAVKARRRAALRRVCGETAARAPRALTPAVPNAKSHSRSHSRSHSSGRARRSCTLVGPTAAAFCRRKAGWEGVHHATKPLESAGSAVMTLIGDFSDSSGTYTTPQAALCAPRQVQQPNAGAARRPVPTRRPLCTRRLSGGRGGDGVEVDAIDATLTRKKKSRLLPYARRPHLRRSSFTESFI